VSGPRLVINGGDVLNGVKSDDLTDHPVPSTVFELLEAFQAGDGVGVDLIRESVPSVLQEMNEVEATERRGLAVTNGPMPG